MHIRGVLRAANMLLAAASEELNFQSGTRIFDRRWPANKFD